MAACMDELTVTESLMQEGEYWVALTGAIVGCICLNVNQATSIGEISALYIDPNYQRLGIGRQLWQKILRRAQAQGLKKLFLDADPNAVSFYQAMGFTITGQVPSGSIPGRTLPRMTLLIA